MLWNAQEFMDLDMKCTVSSNTKMLLLFSPPPLWIVELNLKEQFTYTLKFCHYLLILHVTLNLNVFIYFFRVQNNFWYIELQKTDMSHLTGPF